MQAPFVTPLIPLLSLSRLGILALASAGLAGHTLAQVHHNEVIRFGTTDLVQNQIHPSTGYRLEMPGAQPGGYMAVSLAGVPAGTLTWLWYPGQQNARYEDRYITGHMIGVRPSTSGSDGSSLAHTRSANATSVKLTLSRLRKASFLRGVKSEADGGCKPAA